MSIPIKYILFFLIEERYLKEHKKERAKLKNRFTEQQEALISFSILSVEYAVSSPTFQRI